MVAGGIEKLLGQEWSAIAFQSAILVGGVLAMDRGVENSFLWLALLLVVSLFCLQAVSRRFLWFYPVSGFHGVPTDAADTCILKTFSVLSVSLLLLGYVEPKISALSFCEDILGYALWVLGPLLVPVLPLYWLAKGKEKIRGRVVGRLVKKPLELQRVCGWQGGEHKPETEPQPTHKPHSCTVAYRVINENLVETETDCRTCDYKVLHQKKVPIGA